MEEKKVEVKKNVRRVYTKKNTPKKEDGPFEKVGSGKFPSALMKKRQKMMKKWAGEE
jgi:hypothetical protein